MVALDAGFAPVLLMAAPRTLCIYDVARDSRTALAWPGATIESAARAELPSGPHIVLGTAEGSVDLWDVERLRACTRDPEGLRVGSLSVLRSNPQHAPAKVSLVMAARRRAGEGDERSATPGCHLLVATNHPRFYVLEVGNAAEQGTPADAATAPGCEEAPVSGLRVLWNGRAEPHQNVAEEGRRVQRDRS
jgi:hypothetical protein